LGEALLARHALQSSLFLAPPGRPSEGEAERYIGRSEGKAPVAMTAHEPAILPQARAEIQREAAPLPRFENKLPLPSSRPAMSVSDAVGLVETYTERAAPPAATAQSLPLAHIQRSVENTESKPVEASIVNFVQRASEAESSGGEEAGPPVDLDELARMVYPLIKRILAVEQERLARRR
jgi:hypothetical protein